MRFSHLIFSLAALGLAMVRPVHAEETVSGPVYTVVYFEVDPTEAAQTAAAARQYAEASSKEDGNLAFEIFQEIARPSRFAVVEAWRDQKAAGLPLDTGMGPLASEPDDVSASARDRPQAERERYMREYLAWEIDLVNQIARDSDCRFRLAPA